MPNEKKDKGWVHVRYFDAVCPCCKAILNVTVDLKWKEKTPDPIETTLKIVADPYRKGSLLAKVINLSDRAKSMLNDIAPYIETAKDALTEVIAANERLLEQKAEEECD